MPLIFKSKTNLHPKSFTVDGKFFPTQVSAAIKANKNSVISQKGNTIYVKNRSKLSEIFMSENAVKQSKDQQVLALITLANHLNEYTGKDQFQDLTFSRTKKDIQRAQHEIAGATLKFGSKGSNVTIPKYEAQLSVPRKKFIEKLRDLAPEARSTARMIKEVKVALGEPLVKRNTMTLYPIHTANDIHKSVEQSLDHGSDSRASKAFSDATRHGLVSTPSQKNKPQPKKLRANQPTAVVPSLVASTPQPAARNKTRRPIHARNQAVPIKSDSIAKAEDEHYPVWQAIELTTNQALMEVEKQQARRTVQVTQLQTPLHAMRTMQITQLPDASSSTRSVSLGNAELAQGKFDIRTTKFDHIVRDEDQPPLLDVKPTVGLETVGKQSASAILVDTLATADHSKVSPDRKTALLSKLGGLLKLQHIRHKFDSDNLERINNEIIEIESELNKLG